MLARNVGYQPLLTHKANHLGSCYDLRNMHGWPVVEQLTGTLGLIITLGAIGPPCLVGVPISPDPT